MLLFHGYATIILKMFYLTYNCTTLLINKITKLILSNKAIRNNRAFINNKVSIMGR